MSVRASEVTQGQQLPEWTYAVGRADLVAYANASGDQNPIHQDEATAKAVGLPDVIAHGMQTMAKVGQYVTDWVGDPAAVIRIRARFTGMVVVPADGGNEVTVSGTVREVRDGRAVLDLVATTRDGTKAVAGEVDVRLR